MSEELLINLIPGETRVALVENGLLQEVYMERAQNASLLGNIYRGKVVRVLPGMQAAFVELGLERNGFLHASDISGLEDEDAFISRVRPGQAVVVQVIKAPLGTKGARLSTTLSLSSRYLVFSRDGDHVGISHRIDDEDERQRLRDTILRLAESNGIGGSFIVRTAAEHATEEELGRDMHYLSRRWSRLTASLGEAAVPSLVYADLPLETRALRDLAGSGVERIRIDHPDALGKARDFAEFYSPDLLAKLEIYEGGRPLFDLYSVEDEIAKVLKPRVPLKSGGFLVIEQTEAMTTVDVNTGAFVGSHNLEETIFRTNMEAAAALARQLRVRNLGGIIIIDFIDMQSVEHRRQLLRAFQRALERDRAPTLIAEVSAFGVMEMTRKRTSESLGNLLCEPCAICHGSGRVKTVDTLCFEIYRELLRFAQQYDAERIRILANESVVSRLQDEEPYRLDELMEGMGRSIEIRAEPLYLQEQYDIIPV